MFALHLSHLLTEREVLGLGGELFLRFFGERVSRDTAGRYYSTLHYSLDIKDILLKGDRGIHGLI